jgi:prepilin-type processing-associated H-X9-DG protein
LIELLVVIGIIAILAAMLFPVFAQAREQSRKAACTSNVKQIAVGILMYAQDYDERLPMFYGCRLPVTDPIVVTAGLVVATQPYIKSWRVHDCLSADQRTVAGNDLGNRSYGYHTGGYGLPGLFDWCTGTSATLGQVSRPTEIVMLGDVMHDHNAPGRFSPPSAGPMLTDSDGRRCRLCGQAHNSLFRGPNHEWARPGFNFLERHNGFGTVAFCDGHVQAMKHETLYSHGSNYRYFDWTR